MFNATFLLKLYAKYRYAKLQSLNPSLTQENQLLGLVQRSKDTAFGQAHNFSQIKTVADYQKFVPLRSYEQFWSEFWQKSFPKFQGTTWPDHVPFIPVSSGTSSGTTKWIPCTHDMIKSNNMSALDTLVYHVINRPKSQIFGGKSLILGGSSDLTERAPGIFSGDLSGIVSKTVPAWAKARYYPPREIALLKDWEQKIDVIARGVLKEDIRSMSGVPSWLLIFMDHLFSIGHHAHGKIQELIPNLELIIHGGVNFSPYASRFNELLAGSHAETREVYPASEGFIASADRGSGEGLRLMLDNNNFFEFVPVEELGNNNPTRHWVGNIETDVNYAVVMTTCAGLWSYIIGDTVRFIEKAPPRLLITGRTSYMLSAFGEHLIGEEIEDAVSYASENLKVDVSDYSVGAVYPEREGQLGGHLYVVEFKEKLKDPSFTQLFAQRVDEKLCKRNEDYEAHRSKGYGLHAPQVLVANKGMFSAWMKSRGKLGGQNKVPRIINKKELFDDLIRFATTFNQREQQE
jgi:hypothetical protein